MKRRERVPTSGRGGTGRHASLRGLWALSLWEFDSPRPHSKVILMLRVSQLLLYLPDTALPDHFFVNPKNFHFLFVFATLRQTDRSQFSGTLRFCHPRFIRGSCHPALACPPREGCGVFVIIKPRFKQEG